MTISGLLTTTLLATAGMHVYAGCPVAGNFGSMSSMSRTVPMRNLQSKDKMSDAHLGIPEYNPRAALPPLTEELYKKISDEIDKLLRTSQDFWPADFGYYGGLMIRLAWHCSGTYRQSDGRGGCDGARIRFPPEFHWEDNTNLDKALAILEPLHDKYSDVISWGDFIILTGNRAIASAGGPILGFCGGRIDDADGTASLPLGPSPEQEAISPCPEEGKCEDPLGQSTIGLIYVNPGGPVDAPSDPAASAKDIRNIFGNMGFNDRESVALIGGGHAFGKVHGACPDGPGPGPLECPSNPYPGLCQPFEDQARGRENNTFTSGFEGPWTVRPTEWTNIYFNNLLNFRWEIAESPAGAEQWVPFDKETGEPGPPVIMLTSDIAFINDDEYLKLVKEYAEDIQSLERDFAAAWYRLTSQDMGPASRCTGPDVPPPQAFQDPLPKVETSMKQGDIEKLSEAVKKAVEDDDARGLVANLAFNCARTFRATSWVGGCNGGRIRFPPLIDDPSNEGSSEALEILAPIQDKYSEYVSWADLIVYAGGVAAEESGAPDIPFCPGRVDAEGDARANTADLSPRDYYLDPLVAARDNIKVSGITAAGYVALVARPTRDHPRLTNQVFQELLDNEWDPVLEGDAIKVDPINGEYKSVEGDKRIPVSVWVLLRDPELLFYVREYANNMESLRTAFKEGWVYMMNADRFDGPDGNLCMDDKMMHA